MGKTCCFRIKATKSWRYFGEFIGVNVLLPIDKAERLECVLDFGWQILLQRVVSGRIKLNN